jgi:dipeptidyl aminopeptidase/acylaminoacyl peptidase
MAKLAALAAAFALAAATSAAAQPAAPLDVDAGYYQLAARAVLRVWRDAGGWHGRISHQPALDLTPDGPDAFAIASVQARLVFAHDASGRVTGVAVRQGGRELKGARLAEAAGQALMADIEGPLTFPVLPASNPHLIAEGPGLDQWPTWSPDSQRLVFSRSLDGRTADLYVAAADGGRASLFVKLPGGLTADRPNWSRSGLIAFTGEALGKAGVWVAAVDGSNPRQVSGDGLSTQAVYPSWDADGKSVVVMDGLTLALQRVKLAGGAAERLTDPAKIMTGMANVSPDGRWIAFAGQANTGAPYDQTGNIIWLRGPDGALKPLEAQPRQGRAPSWSPDGTRIAFESDRGSPDGRYAIFVANRDGTGVMRVTDYALNAGHPAWSPDGKHMAFDAQQGQARKIGVIDLE